MKVIYFDNYFKPDNEFLNYIQSLGYKYNKNDIKLKTDPQVIQFIEKRLTYLWDKKQPMYKGKKSNEFKIGFAGMAVILDVNENKKWQIKFNHVDYPQVEYIDVITDKTGYTYVLKENTIKNLIKNNYYEIRNNFYNEKESKWLIDAWKTNDENEEGKVIAKVDQEGNVEYLDEVAKIDEYAQNIINETIAYAKNNKLIGQRAYVNDNGKRREGIILDILTKQETKECLMNGQLVKMKMDDTNEIEEFTYDWYVFNENKNIDEEIERDD